MGKKRKLNDLDDTMDVKRIKNHDVEKAETNGVSHMTAESGNLKVFLIKKPAGISIEHLNSLKWSDEEGCPLAKTKIKTETGVFRAVVSTKSKKERMMLVPAVKEREEHDSKNLKAQHYIYDIVTILPQEVKQKHLGGFIYEEGEEPDEETSEIHPGLKKIKKTAALNLESYQQRNKAYGAETDISKEPRRLSNILKP